MAGSDVIGDFIVAARGAGWDVREREEPHCVSVPENASARYGGPPSSYEAFLRRVARASNSKGDVWFLCAEEYLRIDSEPDILKSQMLTWDYWERLSLSSCPDQAEPDRLAVVAFWNRHFPIMMATHSDDDYLAIVLEDGVRYSYGEPRTSTRGAVVHGFGPEFELPCVVAPSFDAWLSAFSRALRGEVVHDARLELALKIFGAPPLGE